MAPLTFDIVFSGQTLPGNRQEQVRLRLEAAFGFKDYQLRTLFSGRRQVVKRGIPLREARQYLNRFSAAGAICKAVQSRPDRGTPEDPQPQQRSA
jgi:hypothetical protein